MTLAEKINELGNDLSAKSKCTLLMEASWMGLKALDQAVSVDVMEKRLEAYDDNPDIKNLVIDAWAIVLGG